MRWDGRFPEMCSSWLVATVRVFREAGVGIRIWEEGGCSGAGILASEWSERDGECDAPYCDCVDRDVY